MWPDIEVLVLNADDETAAVGIDDIMCSPGLLLSTSPPVAYDFGLLVVVFFCFQLGTYVWNLELSFSHVASDAVGSSCPSKKCTAVVPYGCGRGACYLGSAMLLVVASRWSFADLNFLLVLLFGYVLIRIGKAGWLGLLNVARIRALALKSGDAAVWGSVAASWVLEADTDSDSRLEWGCVDVLDLLSGSCLSMQIKKTALTLVEGRCSFRWLWNQLGPGVLFLPPDACFAGVRVWRVAVGFCFYVKGFFCVVATMLNSRMTLSWIRIGLSAGLGVERSSASLWAHADAALSAFGCNRQQHSVLLQQCRCFVL
ncbi:hypothetical protein Nepgr_033558 [Nepenthes gracilis]|uniref:Transmembrane protein n=1 Tax=Nepenthes gracilis TaxID=150966 RepID=A0AAD3TM97_NEPGR|nr:hypothetical protein Nepgr_033558 [Nepenthes gracilis]